MIKFYCDKCGKEITDSVNVFTRTIAAKDSHGVVVPAIRGDTVYYCDDCQYNELTCGFKVGDKVITSTGKVGVITNICECDQCKKRGFYEPEVKVVIGTGAIWITDNDKRVNFRSFYQIGDHIYGNIDEDCVFDDIERKKEEIKESQRELVELEQQLDIINQLKEANKDG